MPLFLLALLWLGGCASPDSQTGSEVSGEGLETKAIEPASIPGFDAAEFEQAQLFEKWVTGRLPDPEKKVWKDRCKKQVKSHPFCPAIRASRFFDERWARQQLPPREGPPRPPTIPEVAWVKGKIPQWNKLRKERISILVKAVEKFSPEEIQRLATLAEKEKRCPNNWAGAAAARLEDFPDADNQRIARLFEKAGRCARKNSPEREHLLTRAALLHYHHQRYAETERILSKVQPQDALSSRPLYWLMRAQLSLGKRPAAQKSLDTLFARYRFSFHALLAHQQFKRPLPASYFQTGGAFPTRSTRATRANPFIEGMEMCRKYRQRECEQALAEYLFEKVKRIESPVRCYIATFAHPTTQVREMQEVVIARSDLNTRNTLEMLFPRPYLSEFESQQGNTESALLYAVARKESQFDPKACSVADALGLLQLQPATARRYESSLERERLFDPKLNVNIAARYLKDLRQTYSGNTVLSLAAYNAGEEAVARWVARYATPDPILFLDLIPYRETREYVGIVLANFYWYRKLYYGDENPLASILPDGAVAIQNGF